MTKADIVDQIAERTGLTKKDVAETVDSFLTAVAKAITRLVFSSPAPLCQ